MSKRITTGARVTVVLDMDLDDAWGPDCRLEQIFKQAEDAARNRFRFLQDESKGRIRLVKIDKIVAVTSQED